MLDAGINKISPTTFVNIGLQNGVLLRTVLDPINGQLTDTRTRYASSLHRQEQDIASRSRFTFQVLGYPPDPAHPCTDPEESGHSRVVVALVVELHLPEPHALHATYLREPRLRMELLCRALPRGIDRYFWQRTEASAFSSL